MWQQHPAYRYATTKLINALQGPSFRFRPLGHVVFLCGGQASARRDALRKYINIHSEHPVEVFHAEEVWDQLVAAERLSPVDQQTSALKLEHQLAQFSDAVVIIVESPGTFAELGAFSNVDELRRKLLVLVDVKYRGDKSFINTGPVHWADQDSVFRPSIFADFSRILLSGTEVTDRLARLPKPKQTRVTSISANKKQLLFFVIDLVAIMSPVTSAMLEEVLSYVAGPVSIAEVNFMLRLGKAVGHLKSIEDGGMLFYARIGSRSYASRKYLNMSQERLAFVGALLRIPTAARILSQL